MLLPMKSNKLDNPDNIKILSQWFKYIANADSKNREAKIIKSTNRFFDFLLNKLIVNEDGEGTHRQIQKDKKS